MTNAMYMYIICITCAVYSRSKYTVLCSEKFKISAGICMYLRKCPRPVDYILAGVILCYLVECLLRCFM